MKFFHFLLVIVISAATAFGVGKYVAPTASFAPSKETAFERVMRTNKLRCFYIVIPPELNRDPNTGAFSGMSFDIMAQIGKPRP